MKVYDCLQYDHHVHLDPNPIINISIFSEAWKQGKYWRLQEAVFPFSPQSKLQQMVKLQIFPLGLFQCFFFHFQKFRWKMFGHWTLTGHSLNNSERHSEEAMVKCLHSFHQTGMKSGWHSHFNNRSGLHYVCFRSDIEIIRIQTT